MAGHMSKTLNVAVVGATGLVGQEFLKIALQRKFPIKGLRLLASHRSAGKKITFGEFGEITVEETTSHSFKGVDVAFFSATTEVSQEPDPSRGQGRRDLHRRQLGLADGAGRAAGRAGGERRRPQGPQGIIAIPNCPTTPLCQVLWPVHKVNPLKRIIVDTYQSVSGTGTAAVQELTDQTRQVLERRRTRPHVYPHQIAFNVLPQVDVFLGSGYTKEEWKMINETRKIMHEPELPISATCVRVPVFVGHSEAVHAEFTKPISPEDFDEIVQGRARACRAGRPGGEPLPDALGDRRQGRHVRRPHPAGRLAPERHRLLAGERQPAQGRGAERDPDRGRTAGARARLAGHPRAASRSHASRSQGNRRPSR